jgi:hypothetical protein
MATQAQENSRGLLFLAPLERSFHGMPICGAQPLGRTRAQASNTLTVGGMRQMGPQAGFEIGGSADQCLTNNFAQHCNPPIGDTTLDIRISQSIHAPGWKSRTVLYAATQASNRQARSLKPEGNRPVLELTPGNSKGRSRRAS